MKLHYGRKCCSLLLRSALIGLLFTATSAGAAVMVDNFGSDTAINEIQGPQAIGHWQGEARGAISFTVPTTTNYYLDSISVIAKYMGGTTTSFQLALYDNNPNDTRSPIPGSQIASQTLVAETSGNFSTYTADFNTSTVLTAGTTYWAVVQSTDPGSDLYLGVMKGVTGANLLPSTQRAMYGNMLLYGDTTVKDHYWMHMYNPSIKVEGSAVPEPSSLLALFAGIAPLVGIAKNRKK